jgi:glucoamylase
VQGHERSKLSVWRFQDQCDNLPTGHTLRIEVMEPAVIRWSTDGWQRTQETETWNTGLGLHVADLATTDTPPGDEVLFTFRWTADNRWEGKDFRLPVQEPKAAEQ